MNTEERQLAEMLHRVTPEPPRRVTVEDVAFRLASEPGRKPRPGRGSLWNSVFRGGHGWTPVLAALSVFAIAGASAGIATVATSHHSRVGAPSDGTPPATASVSNSPSPTAPSQSPPPAGETLRVAGGMWGAKLINRNSFSQGSLTGSGGSLYAVEDGYLARIDPASGATLQTARYSPPVFSRPVVVGNTVWVVWSYGGGGIVLRGYDARTLAQVASVPVPAAGGVSNLAQGVLTAGPDGKLYVAAGDSVATVDPAARQVTHRISSPRAGPVRWRSRLTAASSMSGWSLQPLQDRSGCWFTTSPLASRRPRPRCRSAVPGTLSRPTAVSGARRAPG